MIALLHNQTTFSVISRNCQSIASKFDEFKYFMNYESTHNCHIDVINLQETWQSNDTFYNDFTLPGYNMYFQSAICSTHYLHEFFTEIYSTFDCIRTFHCMGGDVY